MTIDEVPNVIPIGTAQEQRVDNRYLGRGGKEIFHKVPFGSIGALCNAKVQIIDSSGRTFELDAEETHAVEKALQDARWAAREWGEHLAGFNVVRVSRSPSGTVDITYRGHTHRMRALVQRPTVYSPRAGRRANQGRRCTSCHELSLGVFYVIADPGKPWNRIHFAEVCAPCVERLAKVPTSIRDIAERATEQP